MEKQDGLKPTPIWNFFVPSWASGGWMRQPNGERRRHRGGGWHREWRGGHGGERRSSAPRATRRFPLTPSVASSPCPQGVCPKSPEGVDSDMLSWSISWGRSSRSRTDPNLASWSQRPNQELTATHNGLLFFSLQTRQTIPSQVVSLAQVYPLPTNLGLCLKN